MKVIWNQALAFQEAGECVCLVPLSETGEIQEDGQAGIKAVPWP